MFKYKKVIAFFDTDPAGIMFFGNLFRHIHEAYEKFLSEIDAEIDFFNHKNIVLPIIHTEADYQSPFFLHEEIIIKITVSRLQKSSFELSYKIYGEADKLKAKAKTVHVSVNKLNMQKCSLPGELKKYLKAFVEQQ